MNSNEKNDFFDPRKIDEKTNSYLWTSESVELALDGLAKGYKLKQNPFVPSIKDVRIRRGQLPFKYSDDELETLKIVYRDKIWFCDNFGVLKDADKGWVKIKLRDYQKNLLRRYQKNRRNIIMFPRQSGKTTTTVLEIVHFIITNYDKDIVVIAQSDTVVGEIFNKVKQAIAGLPFFMQPGVVTFNTSDYLMTFDNGCRFKCGIASESTVQGFALDFLYIDEFAYIRESVVNKFWGNIYPALSNNPNSKCIITSTPNGRNLFYTLWTNAIAGKNMFIPYKIYWYDVPGRDEKFKQETIADIGEEYWEMGYELSFDTQLKSIFGSKTQKGLREKQSANENNWSTENHFLGKMFGIKFLSKEIMDYDMRKDFFLIGIDIGEGLGIDSSVMKIKKIIYDTENKRLKFVSVGVYDNNDIAVDDFATLMLDTLLFFNLNNTRVVVENNNYGGEFFNQIKNLKRLERKYNRIDDFVFAKFNRDSKNDFEKGIRWNEYNKKTGVKNFTTLVNNGQLEETENVSIEQYLNFGKRKNNTYAAQYGHDDLVMADVSISYFIKCKNIFSEEFLKYCETELRRKEGIFTIDELMQKEEEVREQNSYTRNGFRLRNHEKEIKERAKNQGSRTILA